MPDAVTDTHGLIWYLQNSPRLGPVAGQIFDACARGEAVVYVPTICLVEILYLQEKGRIPAALKAALDAALQAGDTGLVLVALTKEIADSLGQISRSAVPDMPDRIIAATALHLNLPLLSRDRQIQLSTVATLW